MWPNHVTIRQICDYTWPLNDVLVQQDRPTTYCASTTMPANADRDQLDELQKDLVGENPITVRPIVYLFTYFVYLFIEPRRYRFSRLVDKVSNGLSTLYSSAANCCHLPAVIASSSVPIISCPWKALSKNCALEPFSLKTTSRLLSFCVVVASYGTCY